MKHFNKLLNELEALSPPVDDSISPAPGAGEQPDTSPAGVTPDTQAPLSSAAEVTLVRLLLKALVINIEDSDLSTLSKLDQPEINQENAEAIKGDIIGIINSQQTRGDNEDRIDSIHETMNQINENNRKGMLNTFVKLMKKYTDTNIN